MFNKFFCNHTCYIRNPAARTRISKWWRTSPSFGKPCDQHHGPLLNPFGSPNATISDCPKRIERQVCNVVSFRTTCCTYIYLCHYSAPEALASVVSDVCNERHDEKRSKKPVAPQQHGQSVLLRTSFGLGSHQVLEFECSRILETSGAVQFHHWK